MATESGSIASAGLQQCAAARRRSPVSHRSRDAKSDRIYSDRIYSDRIYRDRIYEGTSNMQKMTIAKQILGG
jgi:hypothetical protein